MATYMAEAGQIYALNPGASFKVPRRRVRPFVQRQTESRNGVTSTGSLLRNSSGAGVNRMPVVSGIVQEAKALGNSRDMLTWTRFVER